LPLFKAKTLTIPYYLTHTKHIQNKMHNLGLLKAAMAANFLPIHQ